MRREIDTDDITEANYVETFRFEESLQMGFQKHVIPTQTTNSNRSWILDYIVPNEDLTVEDSHEESSRFAQVRDHRATVVYLVYQPVSEYTRNEKLLAG